MEKDQILCLEEQVTAADKALKCFQDVGAGTGCISGETKHLICEGDVLNDIHAMIYIAALQQYMMAYRCKYCSFQYNTEYSACVSATVPVLTRLLQTEL